jgi:hypothetical protein
VFSINIFQIFSEITEIIKRGDELEIAEKIPKLFYAITRHHGYKKPYGVLYGSKKGNYDASVVVEHPLKGDDREVFVLNPEGVLINPYGNGSSRYWQGEDDLTLSYIPFEIEGRRIKSFDSFATDRFVWGKKALGGDEKLLDRATTRPIGLLSLNLNFDSYDLRFVGGITPRSTLGGLAGEFSVESELAKFRIGAGGFIESERGNENLLGLVDLEAYAQTDYLEVSQDDNRARTWLSLTLSASAMAAKSMNSHLKSGKKSERDWGLQADVRFFPEVHGDIETEYMAFSFTGGVTLAILPDGRVHLRSPERSLGLVHIRSHFEAGWRLRVSKILLAQEREELAEKAKLDEKEWWTDEEKRQHREKFKLPNRGESTFVDFKAIFERTTLSAKGRLGLSLEHEEVSFGILGEFEKRRRESQLYLLLGGSFNFKSAYVNALKSVNGNDYRVEVGLKIGEF